ncbi:hypothetical protein [Saccharopolyspora mangrovi]|uniref:ArsR family transcriptional regulator n=1 Tax=Saccharopolyspora mangrovi TaxID=3082379 RepID=A0ABU6A7D0_9PSEU|nr:hypothetical protein [Saccharopolyspora sp. S2-29]MEB3367367.1 hypothetical protein [Saccharopolyspora sp. S2-29]
MITCTAERSAALVDVHLGRVVFHNGIRSSAIGYARRGFLKMSAEWNRALHELWLVDAIDIDGALLDLNGQEVSLTNRGLLLLEKWDAGDP